MSGSRPEAGAAQSVGPDLAKACVCTCVHRSGRQCVDAAVGLLPGRFARASAQELRFCSFCGRGSGGFAWVLRAVLSGLCFARASGGGFRARWLGTAQGQPQSVSSGARRATDRTCSRRL